MLTRSQGCERGCGMLQPQVCSTNRVGVCSHMRPHLLLDVFHGEGRYKLQLSGSSVKSVSGYCLETV